MKLLSVLSKSTSYIRDFYIKNPHLQLGTYADQYESLTNDTFGGSEIWSTGLVPLGYQSTRIFANVPQIQKQWAREKGFDFAASNWLEEIARAQIKENQPELVFISNFSTFSPEFIRCIKDEVPSIRLVIGWCCSPHNNNPIFREYDLVLSCSPEIANDFSSQGLRCYLLYHAFDQRVLERIDLNRQPSINFSFVGSIVKGSGYHNQREALIIDLLRAGDLEIWSSTNRPSTKVKLIIFVRQMGFDAVDLLHRAGLKPYQIEKIPRFGNFYLKNSRPDYSKFNDDFICKRAHPPVFGVSMYQKLHDSKVTLNTHGDIASKSAANMRLFEATGVGACLLTDWKENLKDLFEPDVEVATYRDARECIEKSQYLLQHEQERQAMAEAGQRRTLQAHTIYHRAEQLDQIIRKHLSRA